MEDIGKYGRTNKGNILKFARVENASYILRFDRRQPFEKYWLTKGEEIVDEGDELIEVVEKDDYVNGYLIVETHKDPFNGKKIASTEITKIDCWGDRYLVQFHNEDIETVVTKEQYEAIKYTVGE